MSVEEALRLPLEADRTRLEQALGNLVANALAYGLGSVDLSVRDRNGCAEFHVTDQGAGFTPDFDPRAFDRFSRADEARSEGGSGLGLAIVALIARAHGGTAGLANRDGHGADVWIRLPVHSGNRLAKANWLVNAGSIRLSSGSHLDTPLWRGARS